MSLMFFGSKFFMFTGHGGRATPKTYLVFLSLLTHCYPTSEKKCNLPITFFYTVWICLLFCAHTELIGVNKGNFGMNQDLVINIKLSYLYTMQS